MKRTTREAKSLPEIWGRNCRAVQRKSSGCRTIRARRWWKKRRTWRVGLRLGALTIPDYFRLLEISTDALPFLIRELPPRIHNGETASFSGSSERKRTLPVAIAYKIQNGKWQSSSQQNGCTASGCTLRRSMFRSSCLLLWQGTFLSSGRLSEEKWEGEECLHKLVRKPKWLGNCLLHLLPVPMRSAFSLWQCFSWTLFANVRRPVLRTLSEVPVRWNFSDGMQATRCCSCTGSGRIPHRKNHRILPCWKFPQQSTTIAPRTSNRSNVVNRRFTKPWIRCSDHTATPSVYRVQKLHVIWNSVP